MSRKFANFLDNFLKRKERGNGKAEYLSKKYVCK
nr:MAG TPA: hypothetical protein [Caudoviricetes sp.]